MTPSVDITFLISVALLLAVGIAALNKRLPRKKRKHLVIVFLWLLSGLLFGLIAEKRSIAFEISPPRVDLFGFDMSSMVLICWIVVAALTILAIIFRLFIFPGFQDHPSGFQNIMELMVESVTTYTESKVGKLSQNLNAYILSLAALIVSCGAVELFGFRSPTSDLSMTFSIALCTFVLINYYGIRRKGLKGRIKSLAEPVPFVFPIRLMSDIAIPVSLACRLFGNMLGGMIVMELVYIALRSYSVGIPAVLGLYFNLFHPLIQAFIFVTLSLTFISEAAE